MSGYSTPSKPSGPPTTVPFTEFEAVDKTIISSSTASPPSPAPTPAPSHFPGAPTVELTPTSVLDHITQDLNTPIINELKHVLAFFARPDAQNIDALNRQIIKGRGITASVDCGLHLVWTSDTIYIKPLPAYLLNHSVWTTFLASNNPSSAQSAAHAAALGFVRSYALLIRDEVDLCIAHDNHLVPQGVEWDALAPFLATFRRLSPAPDGVAARYRFGQLRMSRLNWAVRIVDPASAPTRWFYHLPYWSLRPFLVTMAAPFVFVFGSLSLTLSAMQVMLGVSPESGARFGLSDEARLVLGVLFWWYAMLVAALTALIWVLVVVIPGMVLLAQLQFSIRQMLREGVRKTPSKA